VGYTLEYPNFEVLSSLSAFFQENVMGDEASQAMLNVVDRFIYSILRLRLSLDGEVNSPCDNLAARICLQILAEQIIHFQC
jgi:hypothetical protein